MSYSLKTRVTRKGFKIEEQYYWFSTFPKAWRKFSNSREYYHKSYTEVGVYTWMVDIYLDTGFEEPTLIYTEHFNSTPKGCKEFRTWKHPMLDNVMFKKVMTIDKEMGELNNGHGKDTTV